VVSASKVWITGTSANAVWILYACHNVDENDKNINAKLQTLILLRTQRVNETSVAYTQDGLSAMVLSDFCVLCRTKNVPVSGTKTVQSEKTLTADVCHDCLPQDEATTILSALMKTWFMAPFKSKACRNGLSGRHIEQAIHFFYLRSFISEKSVSCLEPSGCRIKTASIHKFGPLCHQDEKLAAFSPEGKAGVVEESQSDPLLRYVALVEMKSKCTEAMLRAENELVAQFGEYQKINAVENLELFNASIREASY
jgi:hypothetical protein